jgi:hypothetical protein
MRYKIEVEKQSFPMPKLRNKYPWDEMEVGDSFFVPEDLYLGRNMQALIKKQNTRQDRMEFIGRKQEGGFRVWRMR